VQPNVPSHVKEEIENAQDILDAMIVDSQACIDAGAALVAWPETMVLATMNSGYLMYCRPDSPPQQFARQILAHAAGGAYILFGAHAATLDGDLNVTDQFNTAYLYKPDGTPDLRRYDKMHLVPFGEYIPFHKTAPWLYRWILSLSPYDYDYNLTAGDDFTVFDSDAEGRNWRFGVLICYEDTHPTVTRRMVADAEGRKRIDWLVNLSNDGWYVRFADGKVIPSAELAQRTAISVFRSIENRIAIVRSVNTGISCLIDSTGRIRDGFLAGSLPTAAMERQGVSGWFADRVPIDSRVTVFGRWGRRLDALLGAAFVWLLLRATAERFWKLTKRKDVQ
jgi:apolipoprotein N-acyltransferase